MKRSHLALLVFVFLVFEAALVCFADRPLSEFLRSVDAERKDYIDVFRAYTDLGKSKWYLILSGVGAACCALALRVGAMQFALRQKIAKLGEGFFFFFICVALSGVAADVVKPILGRARPLMLEREGVYGFHPFSFTATWNSMPSGHTTTAFAVAAVLASYFPRAQILWLLFAAAIGVSRVMVNAHYLSDVFAGAALGHLTVALLRKQLTHNGTFHMKLGIFPIDKENRNV